jgi:hypothetical protein
LLKIKNLKNLKKRDNLKARAREEGADNPVSRTKKKKGNLANASLKPLKKTQEGNLASQASQKHWKKIKPVNKMEGGGGTHSFLLLACSFS